MLHVALVGRPNVGKSSIFNRIVGKKQAITTSVPGTTRDWNIQSSSYRARSFYIIDTAGVEAQVKRDELKTKVKNKFEQNMADVDLILFVCDASTGITAEDLKIAKHLRKLKKEILLVTNKTDLVKEVADISEFYKLGLGEPMEVSALVKSDTECILEAIWEKSTSDVTSLDEEGSDEPRDIRVSIVGRPNVGKSSFLNKLIDEEKFIVSDVPGTTRDVNSTFVEHDGQTINFLDTAGLRRRGKIGKAQGKEKDGIVEKFSADRTKEALADSDISILLIDANDKITSQDLHVAGFIKDAGNGVIIVVNKWDLAKDGGLKHRWDDADKFTRLAKYKFEFLPYAPLIFVSSTTGKNVPKVLDLILEIKKKREQRIPTSELNDFFHKVIMRKPPVSVDKHQVNIKYATQADINPPTFVFFANYPEKVHFSYRRYLENRVRENWDFTGTPIHINFKGKIKKK